MKFTERITQELEERGWSRREAARRAGLSPSLMDKVINGYSKPGLKFINGIAKAFNISSYDVMNWLDPVNIDLETNVLIERARHIIGTYKNPETTKRAMDYLEYLLAQEEKGGRDVPNNKNNEPVEQT